jgi:peptide chain release factor 2
MNNPDFWNDQESARKTTIELSQFKNKLDQIKRISSIYDDIDTYFLMIEEEDNDAANELINETGSYLLTIIPEIDKLEVELLLNGKFDRNNAILSIHPGAGGTESQDWAEMLLRMYTRWCEKNGFKYEIVDYISGDEAGIKTASLEISGDFAYGYLKSEIGIHRLVRISPFNAQGKRQTSFASVYAYAEIMDDIEVEINQKDLKIDTYRASGAGGQHVNTTDSAVRITHLPTNIVVSCQNQRSQIQNREKAMIILKSRLYEHYEAERQKEREAEESSKSDIGWGNQIRSYVFQPYQMVKDHRTNFEIGNTEKVMDGELNDFMNAYLKLNAGSD